jgi:hypothetical protein
MGDLKLNVELWCVSVALPKCLVKQNYIVVSYLPFFT